MRASPVKDSSDHGHREHQDVVALALTQQGQDDIDAAVSGIAVREVARRATSVHLLNCRCTPSRLTLPAPHPGCKVPGTSSRWRMETWISRPSHRHLRAIGHCLLPQLRLGGAVLLLPPQSLFLRQGNLSLASLLSGGSSYSPPARRRRGQHDTKRGSEDRFRADFEAYSAHSDVVWGDPNELMTGPFASSGSDPS
jgi:hypothetical protein